MPLAERLDGLHARVRANKWYGYFAIFNRLTLAAGFLPSGMVKIMGERFTDLPATHPMGNYLFALYQTGCYYTFIGTMQVLAVVLLLIPRTTLLGALLYFPIILNICVLTFSVRFDGSLFTAPLMVLANLYLLCWDYHKLRPIFFGHRAGVLVPEPTDWKFPWAFFSGVAAVVVLVMGVAVSVPILKPHNSIADCLRQCPEREDPEVCRLFCACIHVEGRSLGECLDGN